MAGWAHSGGRFKKVEGLKLDNMQYLVVGLVLASVHARPAAPLALGSHCGDGTIADLVSEHLRLNHLHQLPLALKS